MSRCRRPYTLSDRHSGVANFQSPELLRRRVQNILSQSFIDFEFVIVITPHLIPRQRQSTERRRRTTTWLVTSVMNQISARRNFFPSIKVEVNFLLRLQTIMSGNLEACVANVGMRSSSRFQFLFTAIYRGRRLRWNYTRSLQHLIRGKALVFFVRTPSRAWYMDCIGKLVLKASCSAVVLVFGTFSGNGALARAFLPPSQNCRLCRGFWTT